MTYHEIDSYVRKHTETYRLYDWKQIEEMRKDLSRYAAYPARYKDLDYRNKLLHNTISTLMEELRAKKQYDISDKLRDILKLDTI
jgi:hypothetical protein